MFVEAHIIAWNESQVIPFTIKHYKQFCDRVVIYDNYSTDNTREIALSLGCDVRLFGIEGVLSDFEYLKLKNNVWKTSAADLVIVCDCDEILITDRQQLERNSAFTIFNTFGWNIYSQNVPREIFTEITEGFHDENYSKNIIWKPKQVKEINFVYGCHESKPSGQVVYSPEVLPLFHYHNIGGYERVKKRHEAYCKRLSPHNIKWKLGVHYSESEPKQKKDWYDQIQKAIPFKEAEEHHSGMVLPGYLV
jgi:glycosyltransferase involved in cell wall biosynthesis